MFAMKDQPGVNTNNRKRMAVVTLGDLGSATFEVLKDGY